MKIAKNHKGTEIYSVAYGSLQYHKIKNLQWKRHGVKKCWYKHNDFIYENEIDMIQSENIDNTENKEIEKLQKKIQELENKLAKAKTPTKRKTKKARYKIPPMSITKDAILEILKNYCVKNNVLTISNGEFIYQQPTKLDDGLYTHLDLQIKNDESSINDYPDLPDDDYYERGQKKDFDTILPKQIYKKSLIDKRSSWGSGMLFQDGYIVQTNNFTLQATKTKNTYDDFIIPYKYIDYCQGFDSYQLSKNQNYIRLSSPDGRMIIIFLVDGRIPKRHNEQIVSTTSDYETVDVFYTQDEIKKAKILDEPLAVGDELVDNKYASFINRRTRQVRENKPLICYEGDDILICRQLTKQG